MSKHRSFLLPSLVASLAIIVAILAWGIFRKTSMYEASRQLAISTTEEIFSSTSGNLLVQLAHPVLLAQLPAESLNAFVASVPRIMGSLESISSISGTSDVSLIPVSFSPPTASYEIQLTFGENRVTALMELVYEQGNWRFTACRVDSPMLLNWFGGWLAVSPLSSYKRKEPGWCHRLERVEHPDLHRNSATLRQAGWKPQPPPKPRLLPANSYSLTPRR